MQRDRNSEINAKPASTARACPSAEAVRDYQFKRSCYSTTRCCVSTDPSGVAICRASATNRRHGETTLDVPSSRPCLQTGRLDGVRDAHFQTSGKTVVVIRLLSLRETAARCIGSSCGEHATVRQGCDATRIVRHVLRSRCGRRFRHSATCRFPDWILLATKDLGPCQNSGNDRGERESRQRHHAAHLRRALRPVP